MRRLLPLALSYALLTGCIVYDEELVRDDGTPFGETDRDFDGNPNDPQASDIVLNPGEGLAGETMIVFVDGDDLADVVEAEFFGPSEILIDATASNGPNTFVLTIEIPDGADAGINDLRLETERGETIWVNEAFEVR